MVSSHAGRRVIRVDGRHRQSRRVVRATVQGAPAPAASRRRSGRTGVASPGRAVELRELQSRRRELTGLLTGALRENEVLRAQVDRSAAALDASGDGSETSQALRRHADTVRRLHDDMRANLARYRSTERTLSKKEAALDRVKQELKKNRELMDNDGRLPQEDDLYEDLAKAANDLTAKDNLIQELRGEIIITLFDSRQATNISDRSVSEFRVGSSLHEKKQIK